MPGHSRSKSKAKKLWKEAISDLDPEEEIKKRQERAIEVSKDGNFHKVRCAKCEEGKFTGRVVRIRTPAYTHGLSGDIPEPHESVPVCRSCLQKGYYPMVIRKNHYDVRFYHSEKLAKEIDKDGQDPIERLDAILKKRKEKEGDK